MGLTFSVLSGELLRITLGIIPFLGYFEHSIKKKYISYDILFSAYHKSRATKNWGHLVMQFPISFQGLVFEELQKLLPPSKSLSLTEAILWAQRFQKNINISHTSTQNPQHTPHPYHTGSSKSIHTQNTLWPINSMPWGVSGQITTNKLLTLFAATVKSSHVKWSQIHCHCHYRLRVTKMHE